MSEQPRQHEQHSSSSHDAASKTAAPDRKLFAEAVTINCPPRELYDFWRNPENLVHVMDNIRSIVPIDENRSRWTVKAPAGREVSWESVITKDVPGEELYWQSAEGADVANSGRIEFRDAGPRGAIVRATIAYDPPGGRIGELIARLFQREPRLQTRRDLHRFKQLMETGEIATGARNRRILKERQGE